MCVNMEITREYSIHTYIEHARECSVHTWNIPTIFHRHCQKKPNEGTNTVKL